MATQQQAIVFGQALGGFCRQVQALRTAAKDLQVRKGNLSCDTVWAAMATAPIGTDGTIGILDTSGGSGTVAVTNGSTAVTFSGAQSGLIGNHLVVAGDATGGSYAVIAGAGTAWTLQTPYLGATAASASWGLLNPAAANPIVTPGTMPPVLLLPSKSNLANAEAIVDALLQFLDGTAQPAQVNRNGTVDAIAG
jgi:hypothetical protein